MAARIRERKGGLGPGDKEKLHLFLTTPFLPFMHKKAVKVKEEK